MVDQLDVYLTVLILGVVVTVLVGTVLHRAGRAMLSDVYDRKRAVEVSRLVTVLYHLVVLGLLAAISTVELGVAGVVQTVVTKLGIILLINAAAHGTTMYLIKRLRVTRREEELADQFAVQVEQARIYRMTGQQQALGIPPPRAHPPDGPAQGSPTVVDQ